MLIVIMLNVSMLCVSMLCVIMLCVIMLCVIMLCVIMLCVTMLCVIVGLHKTLIYVILLCNTGLTNSKSNTRNFEKSDQKSFIALDSSLKCLSHGLDL
jgi:hypothetical protein